MISRLRLASLLFLALASPGRAAAEGTIVSPFTKASIWNSVAGGKVDRANANGPLWSFPANATSVPWDAGIRLGIQQEIYPGSKLLLSLSYTAPVDGQVTFLMKASKEPNNPDSLVTIDIDLAANRNLWQCVLSFSDAPRPDSTPIDLFVGRMVNGFQLHALKLEPVLAGTSVKDLPVHPVVILISRSAPEDPAKHRKTKTSDGTGTGASTKSGSSEGNLVVAMDQAQINVAPPHRAQIDPGAGRPKQKAWRFELMGKPANPWDVHGNWVLTQALEPSELYQLVIPYRADKTAKIRLTIQERLEPYRVLWEQELTARSPWQTFRATFSPATSVRAEEIAVHLEMGYVQTTINLGEITFKPTRQKPAVGKPIPLTDPAN